MAQRTKTSMLPRLRLLDGIVDPMVLGAARQASMFLAKSRIRHVLVGGLAVGAYGYPRPTQDVNFLLGCEAFDVHDGGLVTTQRYVPYAVGPVRVRCRYIPPDEQHLDADLDDPKKSVGIPIAPIEALVYLKLKSYSLSDCSDVVELLRRGANPDPILAYLRRYSPKLARTFLVRVATAARRRGT